MRRFLPSLVALFTATAQSTITPGQHFAWAGNLGWLDFRPERPNAGDGFQFGEFSCAGYLWAPNVGWINCGDGTPADGIAYGNQDGADFGVNHYGNGDLYGLAWAANVGWINFGWAVLDPGNANRPRVDLATGEFAGYAWSANCGWINLGTGLLRTDRMGVADSDGDGISDVFELQFSGNLKVMNAASDTDQDGVSDRQEYLALTNPIDPESNLRITGLSRNKPGSAATLTWTGNPVRLYRVLVSDDLTTWSAAQPDVWQFGASDGLSTREVPTAGNKIFFQIEARRPLSP